ncbi:MAG TPA: DUF1629 domain-containing protein [Myxococcus sp.]|nr:DUF1629 domain-containing protein [Myxococcus sp.]
MPKRYFDLADDVYVPRRWDLGHPMDEQGQELEDPWQFTEGTPVHFKGRIRIPVRGRGKKLDYSHASFSTPIIHERLVPVFTELAPNDVQFIPVEMEKQSEQYFILVATRLIQCIDDARSAEARRWKPEDGRPEKVGQYRAVYRMRIDPAKVGDAQVFRTWGWQIALIVSEDIRDALVRLGATGTKFTEV